MSAKFAIFAVRLISMRQKNIDQGDMIKLMRIPTEITLFIVEMLRLDSIQF